MKSATLYPKLLTLATLSRVRSKIAGPHCLGFLNEANGMFLIAEVSDCGVGRHLAFNGSYDTGELEVYRRLVTPETRLLVVGAHIGSILLPLARIVREAVAIEPSPESFQLLGMNVAINGITNCRLYNLAAYDEPGELKFVASKVNSGGAKVMPRSRRFEFFYDHPEIIKARCARLDDELPGDFDFILMDIEGAEYRAMAGMSRILSAAKHFVCEIVPNHMESGAATSFEQFVARIPEQFQWFSLTTDERASTGAASWSFTVPFAATITSAAAISSALRSLVGGVCRDPRSTPRPARGRRDIVDRAICGEGTPTGSRGCMSAATDAGPVAGPVAQDPRDRVPAAAGIGIAGTSPLLGRRCEPGPVDRVVQGGAAEGHCGLFRARAGGLPGCGEGRGAVRGCDGPPVRTRG